MPLKPFYASLEPVQSAAEAATAIIEQPDGQILRVSVPVAASLSHSSHHGVFRHSLSL